jgi:hypothetical protein
MTTPNTSATGGYLTPAASLVDDDNLDDIFTAAIAGITALDGTLVRPKWQAKPPPRPAVSVDWCAVAITEDTTNAGPVIVHDPVASVDTVTRYRDVTLLASFHGPNAKANAQTLEDGLSLPQNLEALQDSSIAFVSAGTIRAVPESVNLQWIKRYDLLLYFRRQVVRTYAILTIATAGVELHVDDEISTINITP